MAFIYFHRTISWWSQIYTIPFCNKLSLLLVQSHMDLRYQLLLSRERQGPEYQHVVEPGHWVRTDHSGAPIWYYSSLKGINLLKHVLNTGINFSSTRLQINLALQVNRCHGNNELTFSLPLGDIRHFTSPLSRHYLWVWVAVSSNETTCRYANFILSCLHCIQIYSNQASSRFADVWLFV